jgi:hypothetical protein
MENKPSSGIALVICGTVCILAALTALILFVMTERQMYLLGLAGLLVFLVFFVGVAMIWRHSKMG